MDLRDAIAHGLHLGLAHGVVQGMDLTVDVGLGDMVQIDQCDGADAAAGQGLRRPGAHPANAHHRDMRCADRRSTGHAVQAREPAKAPLQVDLRIQLAHSARTVNADATSARAPRPRPRTADKP